MAAMIGSTADWDQIRLQWGSKDQKTSLALPTAKSEKYCMRRGDWGQHRRPPDFDWGRVGRQALQTAMGDQKMSEGLCQSSCSSYDPLGNGRV